MLGVFSLSLHLVDAAEQIVFCVGELACLVASILKLLREALLELLVVCLAEAEAKVSERLELIGFDDGKGGISAANGGVEARYEFVLSRATDAGHGVIHLLLARTKV